MSAVQDAIERVIASWSDVEAGSYGAQHTLQSLWMRNHPASPPYDPRGIVKLVNEIHNDEFLRHCQDARDIGEGFFVTGGAIQTVGDLNDFLNPCSGNS